MTNFEDDDIDEVEGEEPEEGGAAAPAGNRNFMLALGIMGGVFVLIIIALALLWLNSRGRGTQQGNVDINATNQVIMTANAGTAGAATFAANLLLTPSATPVPPTATNTSVPPTATNTQVVAQATATNTAAAGAGNVSGGGAPTLTPNLQTRTATIVSLLTQSAGQTKTQAAKVNLTATASALPKTGFAEDVGLPGLFGMALGLVLIIILVRRLRLSPGA